MIIYLTTNLFNDKFYIGKSIYDDPTYFGSGRLILKALKKYGKDNFKKEILEVCDSFEVLSKQETYWLLKLNPTLDLNIGYNLVIPSDKNYGYIPSEEQKQYQSKIHSGKNNHFFGKKHTEETKQKISKSRKKYKGINHPMYGKHLSEETKQKLRDANLGKHHTIEAKQKMSESRRGGKNHMFGKYHSKETLQKISDANTKIKISKDELYQLYIIEDKTLTEIALIYNCSFVTIHRKLNKFNIYKDLKNKEIIISKEELYQLYIIEDKTQTEIGLIYNCSHTAIGRKLRNYNIFKKHTKIKIEINKDDLYQLYIVQNKTQQEVADIYNCSYSTISHNLKKYNIKKNSKVHSIKTKQKMSKARIGYKHSIEAKEKMSKSRKGLIPWNKGNSNLNLSKNELYQLYIIKNKNQSEIAETFKCSETAVYRKLKLYQIKKDPKDIQKRIIDKNTKYNISKNELYRLYWIENKTQLEMSNILKCSCGTVHRKLKKFDLLKPNQREDLLRSIC